MSTRLTALQSLLLLAAAILPATASATSLTSSVILTLTTPSTIEYGQTVNGYAEVDSSDGGSLTGTITFYDGSRSICQIPVTMNQACPASAGTGFVAGTHLLTAVYSGDSNHTGSSSSPVAVTVLPASPTASLASSLSPSTAGQTVLFTATFASAYAVPSGQVTFLDGNTVLGSDPLDPSGNATFATAALASGTHTITARYDATQNFNSATSPALTQLVQPATTIVATAILLSSSANPSSVGQAVALSANVVATASTLHPPTGLVTFLDGQTPLGTAALNSSGVASFSTSALAIGVHSLTAAYAGDASSAPSTSNNFNQTVAAPASPTTAAFTISAGPISVITGQSATTAVLVAPRNGFHQPVQLACANLPSEATCTFTTSTLPAGGGSTTLSLNTLAPRDCGSSIPYGHPTQSSLPFTGPLLAGVLLLCVPRRRTSIRPLLSLLLAALTLASLSGCGNCTDLGTRPGTYTIQITGTSIGDTPTTISQKLTVTVVQ
jgi:hypothetical protein